METKEPVTLTRECEVLTIPNGTRGMLPAGAHVRILQRLGGSYTVTDARGALYRIAANDADALGLSVAAPEETPAATNESFSEKKVWDELKTVYDPEIPVNIVDLGLIYDVKIDADQVNVVMTLTARGCPAHTFISEEVRTHVAAIPGVKSAKVQVVWDPPWDISRLSDAAKKQLGIG